MAQSSGLALELASQPVPDLASDLALELVPEVAVGFALELAPALDPECQFWRRQAAAFALPGKDEQMKRLMTVLALCLAISGSSFGAEHVVTHSAKVLGKGTYKAAKVPVKGTGKILKFLF